MRGAGNEHGRLRLDRRLEQLAPQNHRDDAIRLAVDHQQGGVDASDPRERIEAILHQQLHRDDGVGALADVGRRGIGTFQDHGADLVLARHPDRDAGAERFPK